jgi:UDPglucose 6-dehydrogenase
MRICVFGLWHLGCVTAACLAKAGHEVVGLDPDAENIARLRRGEPPLFEPGLKELILAGLSAKRLRFETDAAVAARDIDVLWVAFDTPVDDDDLPRPSAVIAPVVGLLGLLPDRCIVLISSQLPVGSTRGLAETAAHRGHTGLTFGYSPENLRLGKAIDVFTKPDRVVVGLQHETDRDKVASLLAPFTETIIWMGLEAAEMTKHAINAFLATSVVFMNEIATICEKVGADAKEVERGLKSEQRIGPGAYLSPGAAFAGGTLARDITTISEVARDKGVSAMLASAVRESNARHQSWPLRKLKERLGTLAGRRIALLGLTYKPGTDTLRRSAAIELALALHAEGATVTAFDPVVHALPNDLAGRIAAASSPAAALAGTDAAVLTTPWPEFRSLPWPDLIRQMANPVIVDANWFLASALRSHPGIAYVAVGLPWPPT